MADQPHGDLSELNTSRLILDSVGPETLAEVAADYLDLLGTSVEVFEKNGDYALNALAPGWCRLLSGASRRQAGASGKWLCHDSCWEQCARRALASGEAVDAACAGGLRLYGLPITAGQELVGAMVIGYGNPPTDKAGLKKIAKAHGLKIEQLEQAARTHPALAPEVIARTKKRLATSARLIGAVVEARLAGEALKRSEARSLEVQSLARVGSWELDHQTQRLVWSQETHNIFEMDLSQEGSDYETFLSRVHPEDRDLVDRAFAASLRDHTLYDLVHRLLMPDGRVKYVHEHCITHYDQEGRPLRSVGAVKDITERQRAQEALKRSEEHFRLLAEGTSDIIWATDLNFRTTYVSPSVEKMMGFTPEERKRQTIEEVLTPESAAKIREAMARELAKDREGADPERTLALELEYRHKNGSTVWVENLVKAIRDEQGNATGLQGVTRDISERKKAREELARREETLRGIFDTVQAGIILVDGQGIITFANPRMAQMLGLGQEELVGSAYLDHTAEEQTPQAGRKMRQLMRGELDHVSHERLYRRADGGAFWGHLSGQRLHHADGSFWALVGIIQDITERKKVEEELRRTLNRLTSHLENSPLGVMEFDPEFRFIYWSPQAEDILGWKAEEVLGRSVSEINFVHEQDAPQVDQLFADMVAGKSRRNTNLNRNYRKDGTVIDCAWYNSALLDEHGQLISVFCSVLDITERKKAEQKLRASEERYRRLFTSMLSGFALHEVITDDQGQPMDYRFLEVNPAFETLTGLKAADLLGRTVRQVMPETEAHWIETYGRVALGGGPQRFEDYAQELDKYFEVSAYSPAPGQFATIFRDVTERKKADEALKQSEEKFRSAFDNAGIGMALVRPDGFMVSVNPAATRILGYSREELEGKIKFPEITHPDDLEISLQQFQRMLEGGMPSYELSKRYLHKSGETVWVELNVSLVRDAQGRPMYSVSQFSDVTERKKAQEELSEIFNMSLDLICVADLNSSTFLKVNPAFTEVLGYAEQELVGVSFLDYLHPDDVEPTQKVVENQLAQGKTVVNFVNRYRHKDGGYVWLNWNAHPDPEKGITYSVAHDISEQRRYEQELREREALLNEVGAIAKIGGWEMDLVTRQAKWTKATYDIVGIEPGQPIPGPDDHVDWYLPPYRPMVQEAIRALEEDDEPLDLEAELRTPAGEVKWSRALGRAQRVDGKAVRLYGTFQDITERKQAEEALKESQLWLEATFRAQEDAIFVVSPQRRTIRANPAASDILGYSPEELLEQPTEVMHVDHQHYLEFGRRMQQAFDRGESAQFEFRCKRKNGEIFPSEHTVSLIKGGDGKPMGILSVLRDITERKRAEEIMRETQERFRIIFQRSPVGIELFDHQGNLLEINQSSLEIFGLEAREENQSFNLFRDLDLPGSVVQQVRAGESVRFEFSFDFERYRGSGLCSTDKGGTAYLDVMVVPTSFAPGQPHGYMVHLQDITQRKQAEENLAQTQERFRQLMEQSPTAISVYDHEGTLLQVNQANRELWDLPPGLAVNQFNLFRSEEVARLGLLQYIQRAYAGEVVDMPPYQFDGAGPTEGRGQGRTRWVKSRVYPLKDGQGQVQNIVITHEDITGVKKAEADLVQTQERFRQLMEQSPSVIEIYGREGMMIQANQAFEKLWGFPAEHAVGQFNIFQSEEIARVGLLQYIDRAYAGEVVDIPPYQFDPTGPTEGRGQGRVRWLKTRLYPLKDSRGQVQNIVATYDDITEMKNAEEQTKALEAQLRQAQKLEAVGTLAGGIAHDFNNILAAIMGYAELTQDDLPAGRPGHENVEQIIKATRRARDLTRQVLNFSRPGEEHQRAMRLAMLVKETLKLLKPSIPAYVEIRQDISDAQVMIKADQSQMHQVLLNLCTNAAQAISGDGFVEVGLKKVVLKAGDPAAPPNLKPGVYQMLWVKDSGHGMDQNTVGRVFDPFFTTKGPGAGTGMGLSVVHGIVQAHDGAVTVKSRPGQGSTYSRSTCRCWRAASCPWTARRSLCPEARSASCWWTTSPPWWTWGAGCWGAWATK